ncbi:hypothetical protein HDU87_003482 [Geranomyces variabilis]|uniref:Uncharacterized protein n=1 Tax=Geranomyces variabilis TaxID=109894 RepID=A0AAD5TMA0_9FUNG|nr:hypothetical protein HDU87_003482 [Geranomyces variabilis]
MLGADPATILIPNSAIPDSVGLQAAPTALSLLHALASLQQARIDAYKAFDAGFAAYIARPPSSSSDDETFESLITDTTILFADLSREANVIARRLREEPVSRPDLANLVAELQALEKKQLETTVQYQVGQSETVFGSRDYSEEVAALKAQLAGAGQAVMDKWEDIRAELAEL